MKTYMRSGAQATTASDRRGLKSGLLKKRVFQNNQPMSFLRKNFENIFVGFNFIQRFKGLTHFHILLIFSDLKAYLNCLL